jgi:drug/metabolite transporter (DMT)-like permease
LLARVVATPLKWQLLSRGALTLLAWLLSCSASRRLHFAAQLMTLYFSSPIIVAVLAVPVLGRRFS